MQYPKYDNWGWAAIAASVAEYYYYAGTNEPTQAALASWAFGVNCNQDPCPNCNRTFSTAKALEHLQLLDTYEFGTITFKQIVNQIDSDQPVVATLQGDREVEITLVIIGYDNDNESIVLVIPGSSPETIAFHDFPNNLKHGFSLKSTYLTKCQAAAPGNA